MERLNALMLSEDKSEVFDNILSFGVYTSENRTVVDMFVYSEEEIARFRQTVLDSPMINFAQARGTLWPDVTVPTSPNLLLVLVLAFSAVLLLAIGAILLWQWRRKGIYK